MIRDEALSVADEVLFSHTGKHLTDIQRMILEKSFDGIGYEEMLERGWELSTIRTAGNKLWKSLSEALGEDVSKPNFLWALERRWKLGQVIPKSPEPSNYDEQTWTGREVEVNNLLLKLQGQTHMVWLTGISGIGKTALGECLASQSWKSDPSFQWIYMEILEGQNTDFTSVAADLLAKLGDRDLDPQERNNPEQLAKRLLQKLQSHSYWIQLDSLERLLQPEQPTDFVDSYWKTFLERCLTEANLRSRLVLTAQALPTVLVEFSDRYPKAWAEIRLYGLSEVDKQLEFFAKRGVVVTPNIQDILIAIARTYEGHPLVLKVIAEDILQEFAGDVDRYWQIHQPEFEQVCRELKAIRLDETQYNETLDRKVRERIRKSLGQLSRDALDLLCRSAVFRRPVPKKFWLAMIGEISVQRQKMAYRVLDDRALIERDSIYIRQHHLICSVAYDLLKADLVTCNQAERRAAHLWLTAYQPAPNTPKLEKVRGFLEAFNHYYEIEDWEEASQLFMQPMSNVLLGNDSNHLTEFRLHHLLDTWNYFKEEIQLCQCLIGKSNTEVDVICFKGIGNAYLDLGQYLEAREAYENSLRLAREIGDHQGEGIALGCLGHVFYVLGNYSEAMHCYQQRLVTASEINDRYAVGKALGNLGVIYRTVGDYTEACNHFQQHLSIAREIGDRHSEGVAVGNLGWIYHILGDNSKSIEYIEQHLDIAKEVGDRQSEGIGLGSGE
jgi:tetratricopeptide (TPR) repeat protein